MILLADFLKVYDNSHFSKEFLQINESLTAKDQIVFLSKEPVVISNNNLFSDLRKIKADVQFIVNDCDPGMLLFIIGKCQGTHTPVKMLLDNAIMDSISDTLSKVATFMEVESIQETAKKRTRRKKEEIENSRNLEAAIQDSSSVSDVSPERENTISEEVTLPEEPELINVPNAEDSSVLSIKDYVKGKFSPADYSVMDIIIKDASDAKIGLPMLINLKMPKYAKNEKFCNEMEKAYIALHKKQ